MTIRTRATTWAVLPALGLLTWSTAGCSHSSDTAPTEIAVTRESVDVHSNANPAPAPAPAPAIADMTAPAPAIPPVIEAVEEDAKQVKGTVDQEVHQTANQVEAEVRQAPSSPAAPNLEAIEQKGKDALDKGLKRAEDEVNKEVNKLKIP